MTDIVLATLPETIVEKDHQLEAQAETSARALMELRWHWTLDESNPDRVSLRAYARQVGRDLKTVQQYAHAWRLVRDGNVPVTEAWARAGMAAERQAVTEAVAEARGETFQRAARQRADEIKQVRIEAQDRAERKGIPIPEAARELARRAVEHERHEEEERQTRRQMFGTGFLRLDGRLLAAKRTLREALEEAEALRSEGLLGPEARDELLHTIESVTRLLDMLERAVAGQEQSANWRQELKVIMGGS